MRRKMLFMLLALAGILTTLAGCSGPQVRSTSPEDNPEHHYLAGMTALENGNVAVAQEKFERAVYLDDRFAKGYAGLAIVSAEKVKGQADAGFRVVETQRLFENLKKADKYADKPDEEFDCDAAKIRVHTLIKDRGWLGEAEVAFKAGEKLKVDERALGYYQGTESLKYYMGLAYLEGLEFQQARDRFADVLNAKREGKWHEKADRAWKKTDRIVRAMAGIMIGDVGKRIAVKDAVTRADLAALLIDELKLEKLFAGRIPVASRLEKMKPEFIPADMTSHPFREEVLTMLKWKVRGMEPKFDEATQANLFKPADSVSRGEMAFILEDVLIKLTGDEKLAVAYFGQEKSPFPDVRSTSPFYNAVLNMTTRGVMEGELSGEFRINDPVDGAEALLAIRVLNQKKNIY
jgi:tetratricopeptide (TPR) repeat protein